METLNKKIDFTLIFEVKNANPNGDPLNANRPRVNIEDLGEVSDVCLKRKIRNRLQQMNENIFIQSQDDSVDGCSSLSDRFKKFADKNGIDIKSKKTDIEDVRKRVCDEWMDVRTFGQVFAMNSISGFSLGVRGAMSIQSAFSIEPVEIETLKIVKSVNSDTTDG
ncbi:MAG: CRISPR-associated protein, partial [Christensenellales bacterium]